MEKFKLEKIVQLPCVLGVPFVPVTGGKGGSLWCPRVVSVIGNPLPHLDL